MLRLELHLCWYEEALDEGRMRDEFMDCGWDFLIFALIDGVLGGPLEWICIALLHFHPKTCGFITT